MTGFLLSLQRLEAAESTVEGELSVSAVSQTLCISTASSIIC